jgi:hypothetical protein
MLEGGRLREPERDIADIVEIGIGFERGDQHPIERKGGKDDKERDRRVERGILYGVIDDPRHVRSPAGG